MNTDLRPIADSVKYAALKSTVKHYDPDTVESDFESRWNKYSRRLSNEDRRSIESYTGYSYRPMNSILRGTLDNDPEWLYPRNELDRARIHVRHVRRSLRLARVYNTQAVMTYRGTNLKHYGESAIANPESLIGTVQTDPGFASTSISIDTARVWADKRSNPVVLDLLIPQYASAAYITGMSNYPGEHEFLLNYGSQYRIMGTYTDQWGILHLQAVLLVDLNQTQPVRNPINLLCEVFRVFTLIRALHTNFGLVCSMIVLSG